MTGRYIPASLDIPVWRGLISIFGLITTTDFTISKKIVNFRFAQIFKSWCFPCGNDETSAQNLLIPKWKPNRFHDKGLYGQNVFL